MWGYTPLHAGVGLLKNAARPMSELTKLHMKNHGGHYKEQMKGRWRMEISLCTNFNTSHNCTSQLTAQDHSHTPCQFVTEEDKMCEVSLLN